MVTNGIAPAADNTAIEGFKHVANVVLRGALQNRTRQLRVAHLRQALSWTLDALGRDAIDDAVLATALEKRIEAAREADRAITRGQRTVCHQALRRFWSI